MRVRALLAAAVLVAGPLCVPGPAGAAVLPYQDPSLPVATRVADLLPRMSLDEKLGQMVQPEGSISASDVVTYRIGSLLSGGSFDPVPNTATGWADMYDGFQTAALGTSAPPRRRTCSSAVPDLHRLHLR